MAKSGAETARDQQAIVGTWDEAPGQGRFIGLLAIGLIIFTLLFAVLGIAAAVVGSSVG